MSSRELRKRAGQFVFVGFPGTTVTAELRALVREFDLGGVVLFKRNVEEPAQVAELAYELRGLSPTPLWVAVDQEGGRVARLRHPFTEFPPVATLGRGADRTLVQRFAGALASELAAVGITLDFAPVLDVGTNERNPAIGDRALSADAATTAEYGRLIIEALQGAGIAACGKHFPGHGDTSADSHHELPLLEHPPERFDAVEFVPFRAAVAADVASLMVAHLLVPCFDEERPSSLSRTIVTGWLRDRLGFHGLVFTDDLEMQAITSRVRIDVAAVQAIQAGCDIALICGTDHDQQAGAIEAIIRAGEQGELTASTLDDARARQRRAKRRFLDEPAPRPLTGHALSARIGTAEHAAVADAMAAFA
ncbi:MAG: beta-N-acetylhexosaminidase [Vicinamibacterales bacterium]